MAGTFDVVVVGGGPGGYVAALRAAQLGAVTAIVEKDRFGGTCSAVSRLPWQGAELTIDSDAILELKEIPKRLAVIGGGVVGMEFAAMFAALGTKVTVLEMLPQILPMVEADLVNLYAKHLAGLGGEIHTNSKVAEVARVGGALQVRFSSGGEGGGAVDADQVLLAVGRSPYTEGLGAEAAGVKLERGRVVVDDHLRSTVQGVWAIGDVIGGIMLAHGASYEGICAVENIAGHARVPDSHAAPNCVYTDPEIAHVGLGEKEAKERGLEVKVGRFPFAASGRALTLGQTEGAVKVVADARDDTILGVHMVGPRVTDVIAEATLAVQQRLKLLIRRFEERAQVEYTKAKIGGYCHLNLGEEATVVGGILPLKAGDYIYTSYREHGHAIARGVDPRAVMAELFGREGGVAHGRGGSMHIFDLKHRFMGGYGIVGGHLPLAVGGGFSVKYPKAKEIVFCMFGGGAPHNGSVPQSPQFSN